MEIIRGWKWEVVRFNLGKGAVMVVVVVTVVMRLGV